jgi:hypothetical protein
VASRQWLKILWMLIGLSFLVSSCQGRSAPIEGTTPTPQMEVTELVSGSTITPIPQIPEATDTGIIPQPTSETSPIGVPFPLMGSEVRKLISPEKFEMIAGAGMNGVRYNGLQWSKVEPNEGERNWEVINELERGLIDASQAGIDTILIIRSTPPWAQKVPGYYCGPIAQDKLQSFASFMKDLVSRYSLPPYNVKYWELWNEPDVAAHFVQVKSVFGCWGDDFDEYYGGGYYAEMLKAAYPAIKSADPDAQILIGGLLLDCDPTNPPQGKDCKPSKFLEGILKNGGGDYFDIVSFHGYPPYSGSANGGGLYNDVHFPSWEARGGVVLGKVDFLREVLSTYGYEKLIFHTEGSLICPENSSKECNPPDEAFYETQADYVVWLYIRNWAENVKGTIWYQFEGPGWRYGSMVNEDDQPKPAFNAFRFLTSELSETNYTRKVTEYPDIEGYEFQMEGKIIWVLWSPDGQTYSISLPQNVMKVMDLYGNEQLINQGDINISRPVYVELSP